MGVLTPINSSSVALELVLLLTVLAFLPLWGGKKLKLSVFWYFFTKKVLRELVRARLLRVTPRGVTRIL